MRIHTPILYPFLATLLMACDRQPAAPDIDPRLGVECFEQHRAALPPGTQYEGIDRLAEDRLSIRIMNGVDVVTVDCALDADGRLASGGQ